MTNDNKQHGGGSHGGHRPNAGRKKLPGKVYRVRITDKQLLEELEDPLTPDDYLSDLIEIGYRETDGMYDL